jgi:uncharacterized protein
MIVFAADLHGNVDQYTRVVAHARATGATDLIIGGDICPKDISATMMIERDIREDENTFIDSQKQFLAGDYRRLLEPLEGVCNVWVMMGNDDAKSNENLVIGGGMITNIQGVRTTLACGVQIAGYAHVPITPFLLKDWEKYDFSDDCPPEFVEAYEKMKTTNYKLDGYSSRM